MGVEHGASFCIGFIVNNAPKDLISEDFESGEEYDLEDYVSSEIRKLQKEYPTLKNIGYSWLAHCSYSGYEDGLIVEGYNMGCVGKGPDYDEEDPVEFINKFTQAKFDLVFVRDTFIQLGYSCDDIAVYVYSSTY